MGLRRVGRKTVDVLGNGSLLQSFTQDQETRSYDVSVSDNSVTFITDISGIEYYCYDGNPIVEMRSDGALNPGALPIVTDSSNVTIERFKVLIENQNGNNTSLSWQVGSQTGTASGSWDSGWQSTQPDTLVAHNKGGDGVDWAWQIKVELTANSGYSIDGVTQS